MVHSPDISDRGRYPIAHRCDARKEGSPADLTARRDRRFQSAWPSERLHRTDRFGRAHREKVYSLRPLSGADTHSCFVPSSLPRETLPAASLEETECLYPSTALADSWCRSI